MSLATALGGELQGWHGLPARIGERELMKALGEPLAWRAGWQERGGRRYRVLDARDVSAWFLADEEQATWIEIERPPRVDVAATLEALGRAPHELSSRLPATGAVTAEHVWPDRGIVIVVASPIDAQREPWAEQVGLFRPMSFEDYLSSVGGWGRVRPSQLSRRGGI